MCLCSVFAMQIRSGSSVSTPIAAVLFVMLLSQFGDRGASEDKGKADAGSMESKPAKRTCLRHYDLLPSQVLNPMGRSGFPEASDKTLWELCSKGNAGCAYHSELCSDDPQRRNRGLSRICEVLYKGVERLTTSPTIASMFKPDLLDAIKTEAATIMPHLLRLWNQDVASSGPSKSVKSIAYYKERKGAAVDKPSIELSAKALHAWISKPTSLLREVLSGLSDGGAFYTSEVSLRLLLAFTIHGGGDVHAMQAAALSRGAEDAITPAVPVSGVAALSQY